MQPGFLPIHGRVARFEPSLPPAPEDAIIDPVTKVYESMNVFEAQMIAERLQAGGVEAVVRDAHAQGLAAVTVWVLDDAQVAEARSLLENPS